MAIMFIFTTDNTVLVKKLINKQKLQFKNGETKLQNALLGSIIAYGGLIGIFLYFFQEAVYSKLSWSLLLLLMYFILKFYNLVCVLFAIIKGKLHKSGREQTFLIKMLYTSLTLCREILTVYSAALLVLVFGILIKLSLGIEFSWQMLAGIFISLIIFYAVVTILLLTATSNKGKLIQIYFLRGSLIALLTLILLITVGQNFYVSQHPISTYYGTGTLPPPTLKQGL